MKQAAIPVHNKNMVLVDSRNIPFGEIITVPVQTKDVGGGADLRAKTSWQVKHGTIGTG